MSNEAIISSIIGSGLLIACGAIGYILSKIFGMDGRLIRIETMLELWGHKSAMVLRSPHSPELDGMLDKYVNRDYELTKDEWLRLNCMCEEIESNVSLPKQERALAALISATCHHKLSLPPIQVRKHD